MHITLRQLQVFEAVATHLSFTRAAESLGLSQPAVSMQVKQLEQALGAALFEHVGRRVQLTEGGEVLLRHGRRALEELDAARQALDDLNGMQGGRLRVCVASTVNYFAARLVAVFCQRHPKVQVTLDIVNRQGVLQALADNAADIVLMGQPPADMEVDAVAFMDNPLVIFASPRHPLAGQAGIGLEALAHHTMVVREPGSGTRLAMERFFRDHAVRPASYIEMSSNETIKQSVEADLGLGFVSRYTIGLELDVGRLVELDFEALPLMRQWYAVHRRGKHLTAAAQAFRQLTTEARELAAGGLL